VVPWEVLARVSAGSIRGEEIKPTARARRESRVNDRRHISCVEEHVWMWVDGKVEGCERQYASLRLAWN